MGAAQMNPILKTFVGELLNGRECGLVLHSYSNLEFTFQEGRIGMITFQNWMFLSSVRASSESPFTKLGTVSSFVHNGRGVWGPILAVVHFVSLVTSPKKDGRGSL